MEGPSLVIACEEFKPFLKKPVKAKGTAKIPFAEISGTEFKSAKSWGKHLLLEFKKMSLRIHFLMFGSYRINDPRENRIPKMVLSGAAGDIYFYSCAIKVLGQEDLKAYDWSNDLMSKKWDPKKALKKLQSRPEKLVCDVLMDQEIFAGLGNIIKNEVQFRLLLHPDTKISELSLARQKKLVKEAHQYSWDFYHWKKANVLKRNWLIFRKRVCPKCQGKVTKKPTGKLARISHFCSRCQMKA